MTDTVDVLIIGAGASGAAVAWSLAETKMRIVCLEQGDWMNPAAYPASGRDWEARQLGDFAINPNRRARAADYPINEDNSPIKVGNFNAVGGSTILYAGHFPRFHPSDFRVRSLDGVADDWPLDYATLEPFYAENDRVMGVSGLAGDPAYPPHEATMPPLPLGRSGRILARGMNAMGWHWWPSDSAIASTDYEGRAGCINLAHCTSGCAQGAKASTDITYWPQAIRAGVELRTRCRVREITTNAEGMASGVVYYDAEGVERFQAAEVVILACNGIGTPRILLNSASGRFPRGLANTSDQVGRNLMFHPYAAIHGYFDEETDGYRGPGNCIWSQEFYESDPSRGFLRGYTFEFVRGQGAVMAAVQGMQTGRLPWGAAHHAAYRKLHAHRTGMVAICEDLPEAHNRVTLDPVLKDGHGIPAPKLHYTLSENSRRMLDHAVARGSEILRAAGARDIATEAPIQSNGVHLMGTARMGTNPERSVVNEWGRSHDVRNLFIVDGSIFVTSAGLNPTRTIQALALYIADQMKRRLSTLFD
ncbi:MAG: choline dehydrogenase [Bordetella sp. SCN 68-11]|nr:GMC family oxidoreductase [Rhodospirillales bacterium]ODU76970.1 MAG: choline dehydrogenase [Bordetella sp. SCN 68-11]OJY73089.1 MAG: choline dehydrogenase [Rhodospirillales bacterium 70-18]